jgi:hypothetical protein
MRAVDRPQLFAARLADRADFLNTLQSRNTGLAAATGPTTTSALVALLKPLAGRKGPGGFRSEGVHFQGRDLPPIGAL